jgi:hypothetical protein
MRSFDQNEAGEACSRELDLKLVRDLTLRSGGFGFGELRGDPKLPHEAQSVGGYSIRKIPALESGRLVSPLRQGHFCGS